MSTLSMFLVMRTGVMFWLLVAVAVFSFTYRRRSRFWLRAALCVIVSLGISAMLGWLGQLIQLAIFDAGHVSAVVFPVINVVIHLILYGLSIATMFICFEESAFTIIFGSVAAYATQNIGNVMTNVCDAIWPQTKFISTQPVTALSFFVWLGCYAVTYAVIYFVFARSIRKTVDLAATNSVLTMVLFFFIITVAIVIRTVAVQSTAFGGNSVLYMLISILNICCCLTVLFAQFLIGRNISALRENDAIRHMSELKLKQYEFTKENIDIINLKCHDLKHQLLELKNSGGIDKGYIDKLTQSVSFYDSAFETGCEALDVVLTDKNMYCTKNSIQLSAVADGKRLNFMAVSDIYSLFGNALDNATEYVMTLPPEKRVIKLSVTGVGNLVSVSIRNYFQGPAPRFVNGLPQTTKGSSAYHGFGVKSIKKIAESYGGSFSAAVKDNQFIISLLIPDGGGRG